MSEAVENARRYVSLPTVDTDSRRIIRALLDDYVVPIDVVNKQLRDDALWIDAVKRDIIEAEQKARIAYAMYENEHARNVAMESLLKSFILNINEIFK